MATVFFWLPCIMLRIQNITLISSDGLHCCINLGEFSSAFIPFNGVLIYPDNSHNLGIRWCRSAIVQILHLCWMLLKGQVPLRVGSLGWQWYVHHCNIPCSVCGIKKDHGLILQWLLSWQFFSKWTVFIILFGFK